MSPGPKKSGGSASLVKQLAETAVTEDDDADIGQRLGDSSVTPVRHGGLKRPFSTPMSSVSDSPAKMKATGVDDEAEAQALLEEFATTRRASSSDDFIEKEIVVIAYVGDPQNALIEKLFHGLPLYFECIGQGTFFYRQIFKQNGKLRNTDEAFPVEGTYITMEHLNHMKMRDNIPVSIVTDHQGTHTFWIFGISGKPSELEQSAKDHVRALELLEAENGAIVDRSDESSGSNRSSKPVRIVVKRKQDITLTAAQITELKHFRNDCIEVSTEIGRGKAGIKSDAAEDFSSQGSGAK
jgi:hypothetical protein